LDDIPAAPGIPELSDEVLPLWVDRILPAAAETEWESIPWIPSLREGLRTADAAGKPVLLWLMNGHPCGCT
ncbi:hypothetical protein K8I85_02170, partial [bacterium]|nr:hypothetical protein [bacterium]